METKTSAREDGTAGGDGRTENELNVEFGDTTVNFNLMFSFKLDPIEPVELADAASPMARSPLHLAGSTASRARETTFPT